MRLKRFILAAQSLGGAFSVEDLKSKSPELYTTAKHLSVSQIRELILSKDFVPLDLVALVYHANPDNFMKAMRSHIAGLLRMNADYKYWLQQMGLTPEDASGAIFQSMFSNDPMKRGTLNEIMLDGSHARSYNYERSKNSEIGNILRNSLQTTQSGLNVPYCPVDKELGIDKPLWSMSVSDGEITPKQGLHGERCTTIESLKPKKLDQAQFEELVANATQVENPEEDLQVYQIADTEFAVTDGTAFFVVQLTPRQVEAIANHQRGFTVIRGDLKLRCTFHAKIPSFASFFGFKTIKQEMSRLWDMWQRQHGRKTDMKRLEYLQQLESRLRAGETLSLEEQRELLKLRRYKEKRDKEFISGITSLDAPAKSPGQGEGEGRTRQEELTKSTEGGEFSEEAVQNAYLELSNLLDEDDMRLLEGLRPVGNDLLLAVQKLQEYLESGSQESKVVYATTLNALAKKYIAGPTPAKIEHKCLTCNTELNPQAKHCSIASKMQKDIYEAYLKSNNSTQFKQLADKFEDKVKAHYTASNSLKIVEELLGSAIELTEDDLFEGLDLSEFQSYKVDEPEEEERKVTFNDFAARIKEKLSPGELAAFTGTNVTKQPEKDIETEKISPEKLSQTALEIDRLIRRVEDEDLLEELAVFYRA